MEHPSDKIRKKETTTLLQQVDTSLNQCRNLDFKDTLDAVEMEKVVHGIDRARRQFDAKLFFVVIFGPLKAGKSTLTNTLAGEYVSPSGFGKETTRRPSLVISGTESGIDQYFSTDPEVNIFLSQRRSRLEKSNGPSDEDKQVLLKVREDFESVADYLRKIRTSDEIKERIRVTTLPLNDQNLERTLSQDLTTEPLLTVIRCKGGQLLSHGVAIVDMPGLDGSRSNWRDDPIHEWVINRAEFFLFVQSSVAALNNQTHDFLKEIVSQSTKPPIWFVQNIFDAQHWQPKEKREKAAIDQREDGKKRVIELLNESPRAVLGLNVGLAWDAKLENRSEWLSESNFAQFEASLTEALYSERAWIQERNCLELLKQGLERSKPILNKITQHIVDLRRGNKQIREKLGEAQALFDAINYRESEKYFVGDISSLAEMTAKPWLDNLEISISRLKDRLNRKINGKEVNKNIKSEATKLGLEGASKYFIKPLLLPHYIKYTNQWCDSAEEKVITKCNHLLIGLELPTLPDPIPPNVKNLPDILESEFSIDTNFKEKFLFIFDTNHDPDYILITIDNFISKDWKEQIKNRKESWTREVVAEYYSTYCEQRRNYFKEHLQRLLADFESQAAQREEAATRSESLIREINVSLGQIELPLVNAIVAMK